MSEVLRLFTAFAHRQPMQEHQEVLALENQGFEGCIHGRPGSRRQILLMDMESLDTLGVSPGAVKENIATHGLALYSLREGQRLRVGEALLEITVPCEPCHLMNLIRPGLKEELRGRRGMLSRVIEGGRIRCGDAIEVLDFMRVAS